MKIKVTREGEGVTIQTKLDRAGESYQADTVLDVPKYVGDYCVNHGFAEVLKEEPTPEEREQEEAEAEEAEGESEEEAETEASGEAETATAELGGETAVQRRPARRKGT